MLLLQTKTFTPWEKSIWETSLPVQAERGYLIIAVNNDTTDYIACAQRLNASIKHWMPSAQTCLVTDVAMDLPEFDFVVPLPYGDQATTSWKLSNDWQAFRASPFRQTIKLEADMLITSSVDHWWNMLQHRDVVISTGARDYYDRPAVSRHYRKIFDTNNLPDVYNAVTYWRLSKTAQEFWSWVQRIFENWADFRTLLTYPEDDPTTDVVYAMAAQIMGPETVTMPFATYPRIVHMKRHIIGTRTEDWTRELTWEYHGGSLRINTVAQTGAVHYITKDWNPNG
jgi:hypothetical protein